jgi:RNA polymerase sigma factor (sigma-70 family)
VTVPPPDEVQEVLLLIRRCLQGDDLAGREFQARYGELIYGYPSRMYRSSAEDAGDFYVFAFESGRIFRRLRTYEGRAPFRAYLVGFVLDDLVLEWRRADRRLETISLEVIGELAGEISGDGRPPPEAEAVRRVLARLEPAKAVLMKLLYIEDCELDGAEIRYLAHVSGRRVAAVLDGVERLRQTVRAREGALQQVSDALDAVQAWMHLYERRLRRLDDSLHNLPPASAAAARLEEERRRLSEKIEWRTRQRAKLLLKAGTRKVTAPYKDIAALLNSTTGNVGSQIARIRRELLAAGGVAPASSRRVSATEESQ